MDRLDMLNDKQREGVVATDGPVLILAGAGSGKTRVLTHRIAYLIEEMGVNPWNILAITFTNKAAGEMRERVDKMVGYGADSVWVSTFHSLCVRILRRFADQIGYDTNFSIYDGDDQKALVKLVLKELNLDPKKHSEKALISAISAAKDKLIGPSQYAESAYDYWEKTVANVYKKYQSKLRENNAMDFDDLIFNTVRLFNESEKVLEHYQDRFVYIMVDEYQDTNMAQFELVRLLAKKNRNLCVVGDDDQSIYKFRGADIRNILEFEDYFEDTTTIKLEQNYRSTSNILNTANAVIKNNRGRKDKSLWTEAVDGDKVSFVQLQDEQFEASYVACAIEDAVKAGASYSDFAILYRMNALSRGFEEKFIKFNIPYKIIGGQNFYQRKEIKDTICYLKTIDNAKDEIAVRRIINVPKRGIGNTSIDKVTDFAQVSDMGFYEALTIANEIPGLSRAADKIKSFTDFIEICRAKLDSMGLKDFIEYVMKESGYIEELELENTPESIARLENINELYGKAVDYEETSENPTLSGFLEEVALVADIDNLDENQDYVVLMTIHAAKGLEFDNVFLVGMEDGVFPGSISLFSDDEDEMEEERRLAYVAITRARKKLVLTAARSRFLRGERKYEDVSKFVKEIPPLLLDTRGSLAQVGRELPGANEYGTKHSLNGNGSFGYSSHNKGYENSGYNTGYGNSGYKNSYGSGFNGSSGRISNESLKPDLSKIKKGGNVKAEKAEDLGYVVGDTVKHIKFGKGIVTDIKDGGKDFEITVDFEKSGPRKMFAAFAKLKKI